MKFTEDVYALESTRGNFAYLILGRETVLIDTGMPWQGKKLLAELRSLGLHLPDIRNILLTHHDIDHIGNAALLQRETGAALWASREDIPFITGEIKRPGMKRIFASFGHQKVEDIQPYPEEGTIARVRVIPAPGHTPGHVCLLYRDVLFVGDLLNNRGGGFSPMASYMNWDNVLALESVKKVESLSFKWICPAHGVPVQHVEGEPLLAAV